MARARERECAAIRLADALDARVAALEAHQGRPFKHCPMCRVPLKRRVVRHLGDCLLHQYRQAAYRDDAYHLRDALGDES